MGTTDNEATPGFVANRRDVLRTATGLAAAAIVGGTLLDRNQVAVAAGPNGTITGAIGDLGEFSVLAYSWGLSNSGSLGSGGGGGAGKASFQDISLTKLTDERTPRLFRAVASGTHFPSASLTYFDNKGKAIITLEIEDLLVTSLSIGGSGDEGSMTENVTLNFAKIAVTVGGVTERWDVSRNEGL